MSKTSENKLIIIYGPTAIGKTDLAIELTKDLDSFIISADSRQVYKELTIGTAKPSPEEIKEGKIELVDHISIHDYYSAGQYMKEALALIEAAYERDITPILCGGTGLYIKAVTEGLDEKPVVKPELLSQLNKEFEYTGLANLQEELKAKDPVYFKKADIDNPYRVIRALGVIRQTNTPFSAFQNQKKPERPFTVIPVILEMDRKQLYQRIENRVLRMIDLGLVDEVKGLIEHRELTALQTVGYKEIFQFLEGEYSLDFAINEIQKNSRRYAKRQMTWNRNQINGPCFHPQEYQQILTYCRKELLNLY